MDGCAMLTNVNGQLLLLKKEKVWQRERIIFDSMIHGVIVLGVMIWYSLIYLVSYIVYSTWCNDTVSMTKYKSMIVL